MMKICASLLLSLFFYNALMAQKAKAIKPEADSSRMVKVFRARDTIQFNDGKRVYQTIQLKWHESKKMIRKKDECAITVLGPINEDIIQPVYRVFSTGQDMSNDSVKPLDYAMIYPRSSFTAIGQELKNRAETQGFSSISFKLGLWAGGRWEEFVIEDFSQTSLLNGAELIQLVLRAEKNGVAMRYPVIFN